MTKSPREIAIGAVDRLCAYNGEEPGRYEATADRAAEFQRHFIVILAERLAAARDHKEGIAQETAADG